MAFTPDIFNVVVQPFGGDGIRFVNYQTDDAADVVTTAGYFVGVESFGARVNDLVFVSPRDGDEEPYILTIVDIDVLGNGTAALSRSDLSMQSFDTVGELEDTRINRRVDSVYVVGYYAPGDGGGAHYKRVALEPSHAGKVQSRDGAWWELSEQDIHVEMFGARRDNATVSSAAIQAAIDYGAARPGSENGVEVHIGSGIYLAAGLVLKSRVYLKGSGEGATILRCPNGANTDVITLPADGALFGISHLTIDGNAQNNLTAGSGIVIATVGSSEGNSFEPYNQKVDAPPHSYKHLAISHIHVGNCREDGIRSETSNYAIKMSHFVCSHNLRDGFNCAASDGIYENFYIEKNGRCGLWARGSSNKWSDGKVIWNGRTDNTYGGLREQGSINVFVNVEAQDNYCDGILILGLKPTFIGCHSNQNGYLAVGQETRSSEVHADIRVGASASDVFFLGKVYTYKTAPGVGADGTGSKWTTQWPYYFNSFTAAQVRLWDVDFDPATYNAVPNVSLTKIGNGPLGQLNYQATPGAATVLDIDAKSPSGDQDILIRLFRGAVTSALAELRIHQKNSSNYNHAFSSDAGAHVCRANNGNFMIGLTGAGAWNTSHITMGVYHLWIDASNRLRIKNSAPTSDTDGTIVGSQS